MHKEVDYSKIDDVADKGIRLFKVMMRLEFALKDSGYASSGQRQAAEVNWDLYANKKLGATFFQRIKEDRDVEELIKAPPKKQTVDQGGNLHWEAANSVASVQELIGAVRRVRNNLFHGGKSGEPDADRNDRLYTASLHVIDRILKEDDEVRASFSGLY